MVKMKKIILAFTIFTLGIITVITIYGADKKQALAHINYSIAYFENDIITFENYGYEINEKSVFELASNGKVVAAYIALKLIDEGKISLEDKVAPF